MSSIEEVADALLPGGKAGCSANDCKDLGNKMLSANKLDDALWLYDLGLEKEAENHVLLSNRAACYMKLGRWRSALADADECIRVKPEWPRGYGRKAAALEGLKQFKDAKKAYDEAIKRDPGNEGLQNATQALIEKLKEMGEYDEEEAAADQAQVLQAKEDDKKAKVERMKQKGNKAIASKNFEDAILHYSDALEIDKDNHVLYSNRSAAYSSVNQFQSALRDAQKCINLAPNFAKGYGRKGAALLGLNRRNEAMLAYQQGLMKEPDNAMLKQGLADLMPKAPPPKPEGTEESKEEGAQPSKTEEGSKSSEAAPNKQAEATPSTKPAETPPAKAPEPEPEPMAEEDLELLSEFLSETSDLERKNQVERIMKYKLNPFEVLQCRPDMTPEEINTGYRKVSLQVHPDKCKHPRAEEAFQACKKALAELQDEEKRKFYVEIMDAASKEAERELKKKRKKEKEDAAKNKKARVQDVDKLRAALLGGGPPKKKQKVDDDDEKFTSADAEEYTKEEQDFLVVSQREAAYRILNQLEKRRAHAEKVFIENEKRQKEQTAELVKKEKQEDKREDDWNKDRLDRIDSWRNFAASGQKSGIRKPKPSVTEKGVSVLPPTMGGISKTKEEEELLNDFLDGA